MAELQPGTVTAADVLRQVEGVGQDLRAARVDLAQVGVTLAVIDTRTQLAATAAADHETRIRVLEGFRAKLLGISIAVSSGTGIATGILGYLLGHLH